MSRILLLSFAAFLFSHLPLARGSEEQQQTFPLGTCTGSYWYNPLNITSKESCHYLCHHYNLTTGPDGTHLDRELDCTYDEDGPNSIETCEGAKFVVSSECQQRFPLKGPYDRTRCICGDDEIVLCDSDYFASPPPLECESMDITDLKSCIDVPDPNLSWGNDNMRYEKVGDHMMCMNYPNVPKGDVWVVCGDACAYTTSGGSPTARFGFGSLGVAVAVSIGTILLL